MLLSLAMASMRMRRRSGRRVGGGRGMSGGGRGMRGREDEGTRGVARTGRGALRKQDLVIGAVMQMQMQMQVVIAGNKPQGVRVQVLSGVEPGGMKGEESEDVGTRTAAAAIAAALAETEAAVVLIVGTGAEAEVLEAARGHGWRWMTG